MKELEMALLEMSIEWNGEKYLVIDKPITNKISRYEEILFRIKMDETLLKLENYTKKILTAKKPIQYPYQHLYYDAISNTTSFYERRVTR